MAEKNDSDQKDQAQADSDQDSDQEQNQKKDDRSQDEIRESKIKYSDDDLKKGIKIIKDRGYITKKDFKKMDDDVWAHGFERHMDAMIQNDDSYNPYLYVERFDFKGGNIDSIIFDMDQVKSRNDALNILAKATNQKLVR